MAALLGSPAAGFAAVAMHARLARHLLIGPVPGLGAAGVCRGVEDRGSSCWKGKWDVGTWSFEVPRTACAGWRNELTTSATSSPIEVTDRMWAHAEAPAADGQGSAIKLFLESLNSHPPRATRCYRLRTPTEHAHKSMPSDAGGPSGC